MRDFAHTLCMINGFRCGTQDDQALKNVANFKGIMKSRAALPRSAQHSVLRREMHF
jgi:hypothetical protein